MNSEDKMSKELTRQERLDAEIKKSLDARTKEFKEKIQKLTYEKIKQALVPSKEPLKGYPHNESMLEDAYAMNEKHPDPWQDDIDYLSKLDKTDPKKAAAFRKRTKALKKGGGWNLAGKPTPEQKKIMQQMDRDAKKKHPNLYREVTISIDEAVKAGKGKSVADIDYVGSPPLTKKIQKKFGVAIKQTGQTTADVTGEKKNILAFLQQMHMLDDADVKALYPDLLEAEKMLSVSDMNERVMTLKQIAQKHSGLISKAQRTGNAEDLKKAEKDLLAWAMKHNEVSGKDPDEEDDWLSNVVSDKKQFDALLKFAKD
jgi:tetrahydromethanopterin S-methyltransferase subunit B